MKEGIIMNKLAQNVNLYVFIKRTFISLFVYAFLIIVIFIPNSEFEVIGFKYFLIALASFLTSITLIYNIVVPFFVYKRYAYKINEEEIIIIKGVIFRQLIHVPIKRIEHIEKRQGPLEILMRQSRVVIYTAGSLAVIFGLENNVADTVVLSIQDKLKSYLNLKEELKDD